MKPVISIATVALVVTASLLASCGTLFIPGTKEIPINSNPVEATVTIDGVVRGVTPMSLELDNNESHVITISKEGYKTVSCTLTAKVSGTMVVLDVIGTGLIGVIIDATTRGWYKLEETSCAVTLPVDQ